MLAITGASAALALSSIPFTKTIAGVRIGQIDGEFIVNPTFDQRRRGRLDLVVAGTKDAIMMVEAGAKEVSEEDMVQALEHAHAAIREIIAGIEALAGSLGKKKTVVAVKAIGEEFRREVEGKVYAPLADAMRIKEKLESYGSVDAVLANLLTGIPEEETERRAEAKSIFKELKEKVMKRRSARARASSGRTEVRRDPADYHRSRRSPPHPRLERVHARGNASARHLDAGNGRRSTEDRAGGRGIVETLHAPLQLPAVFGR